MSANAAYRYRAVTKQGQVVRGALPAANENELALRLQSMGYELLSCRAPRRGFGLAAPAPTPQQRALLFTQMAALAQAGVPLTTCLEDTLTSLPDSLLRDALRDVLRQLQAGTDLATACARHPRVFPRATLAVLQAGMTGGNLALGFSKARDHALWQAEMGAQLRRALRYPLFLLALAFGVIAFMLLVVVPELAAFLQAQDYALPWHSRALFWLAAQFSWLVWVLPLTLLAAIITGGIMRRRSALFAGVLDKLALRLPVVGTLLRQRELALFLHHLAILLGGGVAILPALQSAGQALHNRAMQAELQGIIARVTAGQDMAAAWGAAPSFQGIIARRAQIGLQTGTLAAQLQQASADCDQAVMAQSKQLIGALEPALTLLVGGMLAWIVLAVLGPLYGALGQLRLGG